MGKRLFIIIVLAAFAVCAVAFAQQRRAVEEARFGSVEVMRTESHFTRPAGVLVIPWHINYQGYLTDDVGNPINDTLSVRFSIWDAASVGTELWNEIQSITVEDAIFNVILGSITPIPSDVFGAGESRWLELMVEAQTLSPRTEITSVGYAYRSVKTDSADYADVVDGFDASVIPTANDLFPLSYGDGQYVNEGQADAITSTMITDGQVWTSDLASSSVTGQKIGIDAVTTNKIFDGAVINSKLGNDAVTSTKIFDGTIVRADADAAFKAPYSDTADYALAAPSSPDNDWTIAGNVLYPSADYGLAMRNYNVLYGLYDSTHVNFGVSCTTGGAVIDYVHCTVGGGEGNTAGTSHSTVAGGRSNRATGNNATVAGGWRNTAGGGLSFIGGGDNNSTVGGAYSVVAGGNTNTAGNQSAVVGGGYLNTASGFRSVVSGGGLNHASGQYSAIGGGYADTVDGEYSFAAGRNVKIGAGVQHTFAFGRGFTTFRDNAVIFYNLPDSIRVGIQHNAPTHLLDVGFSGAYCDGGPWVDGSSREYKEEIAELTLDEATEALCELTPVMYNYKSNRDERWAGFIAEDVPDLVATNDRKGLAPMDIVAVLTKVVQDQQERIEALEAKIESMEEIK